MLKSINPFSKVIATMLLASFILESCVTQETSDYAKSPQKGELPCTKSTQLQEAFIAFQEKRNAEIERNKKESEAIIHYSKLPDKKIIEKLISCVNPKTTCFSEKFSVKKKTKKIIKHRLYKFEPNNNSKYFLKANNNQQLPIINHQRSVDIADTNIIKLAQPPSDALVVTTKTSSEKIKEQPIYKKKLTTTDHKQKKYKIALVDPFAENTLSNFTIETRENYKIEFFKNEAQWMALLQDNKFPGFTRNLTLPVLYEIVLRC
jgi:hypothetical protein